MGEIDRPYSPPLGDRQQTEGELTQRNMDDKDKE